MKKIQLCVLFGGRSSEYEVSLKSAYSVLTHADPDKYEILPVGITKEGAWYYYTGSYESVRDGSWCADTSALDRVALDLASGRREFCRFAVHILQYVYICGQLFFASILRMSFWEAFSDISTNNTCFGCGAASTRSPSSVTSASTCVFTLVPSGFMISI